MNQSEQNTFIEAVDGVYILKTPFPPVWSGCILVKGSEPCLIDSGANDRIVEDYIIPALYKEDLAPGDITWLLNTHAHGDHIGGHGKIKELFPTIRTAVIEQGYAALADPVSAAVRIRTKYPEHSPPPQCYLKGVYADRVLQDGEALTDRLSVIYTPGHDSDCVSWYDRKTRTLISGDSLQGNGTVSQGIAFYQDLNAYRCTIQKLQHHAIEHILAGHEYSELGSFVQGSADVKKALDDSLQITYRYQEETDRMIKDGTVNTDDIAAALIERTGCGRPSYLFLAMYTADEHKKDYWRRSG